jgi:hypothetical protein
MVPRVMVVERAAVISSRHDCLPGIIRVGGTLTKYDHRISVIKCAALGIHLILLLVLFPWLQIHDILQSYRGARDGIYCHCLSYSSC